MRVRVTPSPILFLSLSRSLPFSPSLSLFLSLCCQLSVFFFPHFSSVASKHPLSQQTSACFPLRAVRGTDLHALVLVTARRAWTEMAPLPDAEQPKTKKKNTPNKAAYVAHRILVEVVLDQVRGCACCTHAAQCSACHAIIHPLHGTACSSLAGYSSADRRMFTVVRGGGVCKHTYAACVCTRMWCVFVRVRACGVCVCVCVCVYVRACM